MIERMEGSLRADDWTADARPFAGASLRRALPETADDRATNDRIALGPPVSLSDGPLGAVQAADREIARQTARRARAVAAFAAARPASVDRAQGERGAMSAERWAARPELIRGVSEWAAQELVIALSISAEAAETLLERSLTLVRRLPGTLAALEAGALHVGHLWPMFDKVAPIQDDELRAEVETTLLRWAAGRVTTPAQLGAKARREVARRDARAAARTLGKALEQRGVHLRSEPVDGMATVSALLPVPEAQALYRALGAYADALDDDPGGPPRSRDQKMADCLLDLVLRPGESDLPPVQVLLTVVASVGTVVGGDEPGEIDGQVVPAEMVRTLLRALAGRRPEVQAGPVEGDEPAAASADAEGSPAASVNAAAPVAPIRSGDPLGGPADSRRGRPSEPAWQEVEQLELERWWAEVERRLLLDPPDDPLRGAGPPSRRQAAANDSPDDPFSGTGRPSRRHAAADEWSADGSGWWARADRAVGDAGQALREVEEALAHARRMVRTACAADDADEAAWRAGPGGRLTAAQEALAALTSTTQAQREELAELLCRTAGGGLADRPRIALTDALSGTLLALTDLPELRRVGSCGSTDCRRTAGACSHDLTDRPGLAPPDATPGYRPSAALDRWIRARDRRCRFPGCRRRVPRGGELDHHRPYPAGPTSAGNLAGYCTTDHRGKHQAPGWRRRLSPDGTLTVTTPTGLVASTIPPPY